MRACRPSKTRSCEGSTRDRPGDVREARAASRGRAASGLASGWLPQTPTLVVMRGRTWSPEMRMPSEAQCSAACSGAWPNTQITRQSCAPMAKRVAVHQAPVVPRAAPARRACRRCPSAAFSGMARDVEAVQPEEVDARGAVEARGVVARRVGREEFRGRHPDRRAGALLEPRRAADVVGVVVRHHDALHGPAAHRARELPLPELPRGLGRRSPCRRWSSRRRPRGARG